MDGLSFSNMLIKQLILKNKKNMEIVILFPKMWYLVNSY